MSLIIREKRFTMFTLTYNERGKLQRLTDDEFLLLSAYEFYAQSPTGQYDDVCCKAIKSQLFNRGLFIKEK